MEPKMRGFVIYDMRSAVCGLRRREGGRNICVDTKEGRKEGNISDGSWGIYRCKIHGRDGWMEGGELGAGSWKLERSWGVF